MADRASPSACPNGITGRMEHDAWSRRCVAPDHASPTRPVRNYRGRVRQSGSRTKQFADDGGAGGDRQHLGPSLLHGSANRVSASGRWGGAFWYADAARVDHGYRAETREAWIAATTGADTTPSIRGEGRRLSQPGAGNANRRDAHAPPDAGTASGDSDDQRLWCAGPERNDRGSSPVSRAQRSSHSRRLRGIANGRSRRRGNHWSGARI